MSPFFIVMKEFKSIIEGTLPGARSWRQWSGQLNEMGILVSPSFVNHDKRTISGVQFYVDEMWLSGSKIHRGLSLPNLKKKGLDCSEYDFIEGSYASKVRQDQIDFLEGVVGDGEIEYKEGFSLVGFRSKFVTTSYLDDRAVQKTYKSLPLDISRYQGVTPPSGSISLFIDKVEVKYPGNNSVIEVCFCNTRTNGRIETRVISPKVSEGMLAESDEIKVLLSEITGSENTDASCSHSYVLDVVGETTVRINKLAGRIEAINDCQARIFVTK